MYYVYVCLHYVQRQRKKRFNNGTYLFIYFIYLFAQQSTYQDEMQ